MKRSLLVLLAVIVGTIPYVLAQQPATETTAPPPPVDLLPTDHQPLPSDVSQYWFVPVLSADRQATRGAKSFGNLARGVQAIAAGDYAAGLSLVSDSGLRETHLADYASFYRGVALQGLNRLPEADGALTALVGSTPHGYLSEASRLKLAEVALARHEPERAKGLLRGLSNGVTGRDDAFMMLGEAEEALDHRGHAAEAYRAVYYESPLSQRAPEAGAVLERLQSAGGVPGAPFGEELARAERLFAARRWTDARLAFESLAGRASGDDRALVSIRLAQCDVHLGRHRAARERLKPYLTGTARAAEARYFYLRAVRELGDRTNYVSLSRALVRDQPDSPWAADALDDLASFYIIGDEDDLADRVFRELLERFPRHRHAQRAAWKVGWAAYRAGRFAETVKIFESAASSFARADYRPAWLYWSGRARDRIGDGSGAAARYQLVVTDYGSSYYGRLASRLLSSRAEAGVPARAQLRAAVAASAPPTAAVMQALMTAGLFDDALREVQFAQRTWGDSPQLQATGAWVRHQQAKSLHAEERFAALRGSITIMRRAYPQFLSAEGERLPLDVLRIIFPLDYWDLIDRHSRANDLDPYLVAALMAQESTFTPEIRSSANARGLMQVIPATGRIYARKLGIRPFTTASLFQPETNVRIGVRYFKDLVDRFGGTHYALAGYNAGHARVAEWIKEEPDLPPDEFIDNIPFPETQNYVKRILGTAEDYRRLYGTGQPAPSRRVASAAAAD